MLVSRNDILINLIYLSVYRFTSSEQLLYSVREVTRNTWRDKLRHYIYCIQCLSVNALWFIVSAFEVHDSCMTHTLNDKPIPDISQNELLRHQLLSTVSLRVVEIDGSLFAGRYNGNTQQFIANTNLSCSTIHDQYQYQSAFILGHYTFLIFKGTIN